MAQEKSMNQLRPALASFVLMTVLTGVVYPLLVTGLAQILFPARANGSLVTRDGKAVGSTLIGQPFDDPKYFWSRPSATSPVGYNGAVSSGSNQGPLSEALLDAVRDRVEALKAADPDNRLPIPVDLVTASGSGLDPHISPAAARYQVARVARARGLSETTVQDLVTRNTRGRWAGVFGEPVVEVLPLNLALDALGAR
jgi:K+-transporting ATPase ATPase C chain